MLRQKYLEKLKTISSKHRFITDKMPQNFRFVSLILSALPQAKIINLNRHPAATCWSNYTHFFPSDGLGYSYDLTDLVDYYELYDDLMMYWNTLFGDKIYHLNYEQLTQDPETQTRSLIQYIGLPWRNECLAPQKISGL